jgi:hypothetical protein
MPAFTRLRGWIDGVLALLRREDPGASWRPAAEANGLTDIRGLSVLGITEHVMGWKGSLHVLIEAVPRGAGPGRMRITVSGVARGLSLRTEGLATRVQKRFGLDRDIQTGDVGFDADFMIVGDGAVAHAVLDADTRGALRRLFGAQDSSTLAAGTLSVDFARTTLDAKDLEQMLALAQGLVEPDDVGARIARNALEDRVDGVRRRCLLALLEGYGGHAATRDAVRRARADASEDVRLEAALASGEEALPVLRALALSGESEACAARAIRALGSRLEAAEARRLLERGLARRRLAVTIACIEVLGEPGRGSAEVEKLLIGRCLGDADQGVRSAAAVALGRTGTVAAVLPLQAAAGETGGALGRAMRDAAREIQSRLLGAERGQLTVSSAEGGTVTLAAEGGELSPPEPDTSGGR